MLIFAPVCGSSIMSLRSMDLKRPLRARSSLTMRATSKESAAAAAAVNGTMAGRHANRLCAFRARGAECRARYESAAMTADMRT